MENLTIYEKVREVPQEAQKTITGGKLNGFTDINPMWRIKKLTELFGLCGIGWYTEITKRWTEEGAGGEKAAFCEINLYVKQDGEWSKPISGTGGASFISTQKGKLVTSDEAFKMAYTDAISVVCKMLGFGADIYWSKDRTKYDTASDGTNIQEPQGYGSDMNNVTQFEKGTLTPAQLKIIGAFNDTQKKWVLKTYKVKSIDDLTTEQASAIIKQKEAKEAQKEAVSQ
jgi:hypothetical protein